MTRPKNELPKLRRHKGKNRAYFQFRKRCYRRRHCGLFVTNSRQGRC